MNRDSTIAAIATPPGTGAIAIIRLSGNDAIGICERVFRSSRKGKKISQQPAYTIHHGKIVDKDKEVDDVLVSLFKAPNSYTGEDIVEISCHGSILIQQRILELVIKNGATLAQQGEFTLRAFLNGKMDLSQAEAVADLIAANSEAAHRVAIEQMRGGFSDYLKQLREKLLHFISLVELELDFAEEDVEFANRSELLNLIENIKGHTDKLLKSFTLGNVIKNGIPVTIVGKPNVGKSTLLNRLLNEEKAIVSEIAGTTRDSIEDTIHINGMLYRFIDTAGLRHTTDSVESLGIERTHKKISQALVLLLMIDARDSVDETIAEVEKMAKKIKSNQKMLVLLNKTDLSEARHLIDLKNALHGKFEKIKIIDIAAKYGVNLDLLMDNLFETALTGSNEGSSTIVTNARHYESLLKAHENIERVIDGLKSNLSGDLLAMDIRQVLHYLGEITGDITTDEILGTIFSKFCIGK
jgi:tRNA modification GTPase